MNNKEILNQIVECLSLIAVNPNVYSHRLKKEIETLSEMIDEEDTDSEE